MYTEISDKFRFFLLIVLFCTKMPHQHCQWCQCTADSRKAEDGVKFYRFPKPNDDEFDTKLLDL